jgi:hypothetical protein
MNTNILNFCESYKEKLKTDKGLKDKYENYKNNYIDDYSPIIKFIIKKTTYFRGQSDIMEECLFTLDSEDLEYLYNKYSKLLNKELEDNIRNMRNLYINT